MRGWRAPQQEATPVIRSGPPSTHMSLGVSPVNVFLLGVPSWGAHGGCLVAEGPLRAVRPGIDPYIGRPGSGVLAPHPGATARLPSHAPWPRQEASATRGLSAGSLCVCMCIDRAVPHSGRVCGIDCSSVPQNSGSASGAHTQGLAGPHLSAGCGTVRTRSLRESCRPCWPPLRRRSRRTSLSSPAREPPTEPHRLATVLGWAGCRAVDGGYRTRHSGRCSRLPLKSSARFCFELSEGEPSFQPVGPAPARPPAGRVEPGRTAASRT